jgi:beta-carotene ketolase (CrtO type)
MSGYRRDVVVVGGGHNGLVCACYLARAGLSVTVLEAAPSLGGCLHTVDFGPGARLELGAYEHGGIRGSGVAAELELETTWGLELIERDELCYAPADDGTALAFHRELEHTVELLGPIVGPREIGRYRTFAAWSRAAVALLYQLNDGPAPSMRQLAALAETALGADGVRLVQTLLAPASIILRATFDDERLRGVLGHWAAHLQQAPSDPGTGAGALLLAGSHGFPAVRAAGGSRAITDALVRCLEAHGGTVACESAVERIEVRDGRVTAVVAGGERHEVARAVVSSIDARRVFLDLLAPDDVPGPLLAEVRRIHSGHRNVTELKVDAIIDGPLPALAPSAFARSLLLSANSLTDLERSFAEIALGRLPSRPPLMFAFPSALEPGWAPPGRHVIWLQAFVPWALDGTSWDASQLERGADLVWAVAERALGQPLSVVDRKITGPLQWLDRHGSARANPNQIDMSIDQLLDLRPSPSLSRYRAPLRGLYLTGAGTHPGGGVTGAPGRNTARVVLRDLGATRRAASAQRLRETLASMRDAARAIRALRRD